MSPPRKRTTAPRGGGNAAPRQRSTTTRRPLRIIPILLIGFVLVAIGVISRRSMGIGQAKAIRALERRRAALEAEATTEETAIRELSSRARLAPLAEQRLHMRIPADSQVIILPRRSTPSAPH